MSKSVLPEVNQAVIRDLNELGSSIRKASRETGISERQLGRQIRGESKDGIIPLGSLSAMFHADQVKKETVEKWWGSAKKVYRIKAGPLPWRRRLTEKIKALIERAQQSAT